MTREVDDLGAGRLGHLDVAGLGDSDQLADHRVWVLDVLEHVRADDVVEGRVGKRHVGGVGVEQRSIDTRRSISRALPAVLVADEAVEEHVGTPVRLVAAADVEHRARCDRPGWRCAADRTNAAVTRTS